LRSLGYDAKGVHFGIERECVCYNITRDIKILHERNA
jgi:hypothetical protein